MQLSVLRHRDGTPVNVSDIDALGRILDGRVLSPGEHAYEDACRNIEANLRPSIVIRCLSIDDVRWVVLFAAMQDIPLAVLKGRREDRADTTAYQNRLVVELTSMKRITVLPEIRMVHVEAGASLIDVENSACRKGLTVPGILTLGSPEVSVASIDWTSVTNDRRGVSFVSFEGVTLKGLVVIEAPEFEALGEFAVVTGFTFRALPLVRGGTSRLRPL